MLVVKRLMVLALAIVLWLAIAGYGAISGWWLTPVAPKGDTAAFLKAAIALGDAQSRGNFALVLLRDGAVYAEHFEPSVDDVDRDTRFPLASASKWVAAYGAMQLVQAGKIDLDAPVSRYLKRWQLPAGEFDTEGVTVRRLLSHTAGLTDGLGFGDYGPEEVLPSLEDSLEHPRSSSGTARIALGHEPGSEWQYSGGAYLILQLIVEEVSGMSFAEWMQQAVFEPIGMQRSSFAYLGDLDNASRSYDADGKLAPSYRYSAAAATGLSSSAGDLIRFAQAQLRDDPEGAQVLSLANVATMRQPHGRKLGADIWGLGVMLYAPTASGAYVFGHDGSNEPAINSSLRINPDNGDAILVLVTGSPALASSIAYEWTVWQTGSPDFLMVDRAFGSALMPLAVGTFFILVIFTLFVVRQRRRKQRPA